jgi:lysophospholipase L1-like esterase
MPTGKQNRENERPSPPGWPTIAILAVALVLVLAFLGTPDSTFTRQKSATSQDPLTTSAPVPAARPGLAAAVSPTLAAVLRSHETAHVASATPIAHSSARHDLRKAAAATPIAPASTEATPRQVRAARSPTPTTIPSSHELAHVPSATLIVRSSARDDLRKAAAATPIAPASSKATLRQVGTATVALVTTGRPQRYAVVFEGDSLTWGQGASPGHRYPSLVRRHLPDQSRYGVPAVPGDTWLDLDARAETLDSTYGDGRGTHVLVVWAGSNDLNEGRSVGDTYQDMVAYCLARRLTGWRVLVLTVLPRSQSDVPTGYERDREALNSLIRKNWPSFADGLVDIASDPRLGVPGDEKDRTYYLADRIHLTDRGYGLVARHVLTGLSGLVPLQ